MKAMFVALLTLLGYGLASAEVTGVTITSRGPVAGGQAFGNTGAYEKLVGRIDFAIDPAHVRNKAIVDLDLAAKGADGRVHFSADLFVLQPVDAAKGNGALLFEISNRGGKGMLGMFNRARGSNNPEAAADFGDGFLMREGYTLVWVGWQFDVAAPLLRVDAPRADLKGRPDTVNIGFIVNAPGAAVPAGLPNYLPADPREAGATLSVRDRHWQQPTSITRDRWQFATPGERPQVELQGGFEPGRLYELTYRSLDAVVAGVGLAAIRDAASAFLYRQDLPVRGRTAYVFGISQSGRFLRQFMTDGFNVDERDRRVFHAVWPHIAGAGLGSFNERFAMPGYSAFPATRFPFTDREQTGPGGLRGSILGGYRAEHQPKVIYTNTPVEYWGQGRAAALTHTSIDGTSDLALPDNVRMYLLAGSQHGEAAMPPNAGGGQELGNPIPQRNVMRALLRSMHAWVTTGTAPPDSRIPRLRDKTLVKAADAKFPALPGVADPRTIEGPGLTVGNRTMMMPFLVPQVDADGNDLAGIRVPEQLVPLATTTGWNFRSQKIGNTATILALAGSYIPFAKTAADRAAKKDPRPSIAERYAEREDYLKKIRAAAEPLIKGRYLLAEDLDDVMQRATQHWSYATGTATTTNSN